MRSRSVLAVLVTIALVAPGSVTGRPAAAAAGPPAPPATPSVEGRAQPVTPVAPDPAADAAARPDLPIEWPAPGRSEVDLTGPARAAATGGVTLSNLDGEVGRLGVEFLDRGATPIIGERGLGLRLTRLDGRVQPGRVRLELDYSRFRAAAGGDFGARLRVFKVSAGLIPVPTRNQAGPGRLIAEVDVAGAGATDLVVAAAADGSTGSFAATTLSPTASWEVGLQSGDFTWSYPVKVPDLPGPEPRLSFDYSSASVDGRAGSSNNQPSWVGEGFELAPGYIERAYRQCNEDPGGNAGVYDRCWVSDNAFSTFPGLSGQLVRDDTTGTWKAGNDDGWRVEQLTGTVNGDNNGEYWKLTSPDGTQYFFGLGRLPGWASGNTETQSVWTQPVFGNHAGEPCRAASAANSWCQQGYRWHLDYIVDRYGDAISYFYQKENNIYGRWSGGEFIGTETPYVRGGHLVRIDYGQRHGAVYSTPAAARVVFNTADRCTSTGSACDPANSANWSRWPDVPWDQQCRTSCWLQLGLGYWTTKRLASVTTQVRSGTGYANVATVALRQSYPDPYPSSDPWTENNDASKSLWLNGLTLTGHVGGIVALPEITFEGVALKNRHNSNADFPAHYKWRVAAINNETGGRTEIAYSAPQCGGEPYIFPDRNVGRCYPRSDMPAPHAGPDVFYKYVPLQVREVDRVGGNPTRVTSYDYVGDAAWRYDDSDATPAGDRDWNQWRGYQRVIVRTGAGTKTEHLFHRGMHGDRLIDGSRRSVTVTDSQGVAITDHEWLRGFHREQIQYLGDTATVVQYAAKDPRWSASPTATRARTAIGLDPVQAYQFDIGVERERVPLSDGTIRVVEKRHTYDAYNQLERTDDLGDLSTSNDDSCVRITYARNLTAWILVAKSRMETVSVNCATTPSYPDDLVSDLRAFFDGSATWGSPPSKADTTRMEEAVAHSAGAPAYTLIGQAVHDQHGRPVRTTSATGGAETTAFTPAAGGPVTSVTVTNAIGHTQTTAMHPLLGLPTGVTQVNGTRSDLEYDPLGRLLRGHRNGVLASEFGYSITKTAASAVSHRQLRGNGTYATSYTLYDGLLRVRQTQHPGPNGGRIVADTTHDANGRPFKTNEPFHNASAPAASILAVADSAVPSQKRTLYDGADRPVAQVLLSNGLEKWRTTSAYGGNWVSIDPPHGGTATMSIMDARDQIVEFRQYGGGAPTGSYTSTRYGYDRAGRPTSVTDAAGNVWRNTYDSHGRRVRGEDPDTGVSTTSYDALGRVASTTDARGRTLTYTYDAIGRRTGVREGATQLSEWVYDTLKPGMLTSSTRYVGGNAYTTSVLGYDAAGRPTGTAVTIPAAEGALAGTYKTEYTYNAADQVTSIRLPYRDGQTSLGGLPDETLTAGYGANGLPDTLSGLTTYVASTAYTDLSQVQRVVLGSAGAQVWRTLTYDPATGRMTRALTERESAAQPVIADVAYEYDEQGNIVRIADTPAGRAADVQCFGYDHLQRLTQAWTPASGACAGAPSVSGLGGPAPYWQSFTYDAIGNRLTDVWHAAAGDTTKSYSYGSVQPHTVKSVAVSGPGVSRTDTFTYDASGNTTARTVAGVTQSLAWSAEGQMTAIGGSTVITDAGGARLLRKDSNGTTLYLGGGTELRLNGTVVTGTRYYQHHGTTVAVRTGQAVSWLVPDHQGTAIAVVNASTLEPTYRRSLPFGGQRGGTATWPGERGFVGGTRDPSGLVHLGMREYDPELGRFLSADQLIDPEDPQQLHGYAYADNSPVTFADPTGFAKCKPNDKKCWEKEAEKLIAEWEKLKAWAAKTAHDIISEMLATLERLGKSDLNIIEAAVKLLNDVWKALGAGLKAVNEALDKAGLYPIDYVVLEVAGLREIKSKLPTQASLRLDIMVDFVAVAQITGCGCNRRVKVTVKAVAKIRAQIRAKLSNQKHSLGAIGLSFVGIVSRTGQAFLGANILWGTGEGVSASVRAGKLLMPKKGGGYRGATGKEVDKFIGGFGAGISGGALNATAGIAISLPSDGSFAIELGRTWTFYSGANLLDGGEIGVSVGWATEWVDLW